jgi:aminoglycoside phosphotransferase (APT) family kinase protein
VTEVRLHADQVDVDAPLVQRLLNEQFADWCELPIRRVPSAGTDNAVFRLGDELAVRLPMRPSAVDSVRKELRWLPVLAPRLSLAVPQVLGAGEPGAGYPFPWAVVRWLPGRDALAEPPEPASTAAALGRFVAELRAIDTQAVPSPLTAETSRGGPLAARDPYFRDYLAQCAGLVDTAAVAAVWDRALAAPAWAGPPVWLHADLLPSNLLVRDGRLAGVLDFGTLCTGDPAFDLTAAWHVFDAATRPAFLDLAGVDGPALARAGGLVALWGIGALSYYLHTNPGMVAMARASLAAVLADGCGQG